MPESGDRQYIKVLSVGNYLLGFIGLILSSLLRQVEGLSQWFVIDLGFFPIQLPYEFLLSLLIGFLFVLNGLLLSQQIGKMVSYPIVIIQLFYVPLGSLLGICTLVFLHKRTIEKWYHRQLKK